MVLMFKTETNSVSKYSSELKSLKGRKKQLQKQEDFTFLVQDTESVGDVCLDNVMYVMFLFGLTFCLITPISYWHVYFF